MINFSPLLWWLGFCVCLFILGFSYGRHKGHEQALKEAVTGFKQSQVIQHEVQKMDDYNVCLKLGGLPDECAELMHGAADRAAHYTPLKAR